MTNDKKITKEDIEKVLKDTMFPDNPSKSNEPLSIKTYEWSDENGSYRMHEISGGGMTLRTGDGGLEEFNKAMKDEANKLLNDIDYEIPNPLPQGISEQIINSVVNRTSTNTHYTFTDNLNEKKPKIKPRGKNYTKPKKRR